MRTYIYTLTSAARPSNLPRGQATILYSRLEPYGSAYTLNELVVAVKQVNYQATFKRGVNSVSVRDSLRYHLN